MTGFFAGTSCRPHCLYQRDGSGEVKGAGDMLGLQGYDAGRADYNMIYLAAPSQVEVGDDVVAVGQVLELFIHQDLAVVALQIPLVLLLFCPSGCHILALGIIGG